MFDSRGEFSFHGSNVVGCNFFSRLFLVAMLSLFFLGPRRLVPWEVIFLSALPWGEDWELGILISDSEEAVGNEALGVVGAF